MHYSILTSSCFIVCPSQPPFDSISRCCNGCMQLLTDEYGALLLMLVKTEHLECKLKWQNERVEQHNKHHLAEYCSSSFWVKSVSRSNLIQEICSANDSINIISVHHQATKKSQNSFAAHRGSMRKPWQRGLNATQLEICSRKHNSFYILQS